MSAEESKLITADAPMSDHLVDESIRVAKLRNKRVSGGPKSAELRADRVSRRWKRGQGAKEIAALFGWTEGSIDEWMEMLLTAEGGIVGLERFESICPQHFVLELTGTSAMQKFAANQTVIDGLCTINKRWRNYTGRPLISMVVC